MRTPVLAVLIVLALGGCVRYTPHPWSQEFEFDDADVEFVTPTRIIDIQCERRAEAIERLEQVSFVRLTPEEYAAISNDPMELADDDIPYLVRGVPWSEPPMFSIVAVDRDQRILYVTQYTHNFEMAWPGLHWKMRPRPVIVVLKQEIGRAMTRGIIGGDRVLGLWLRYGEFWSERGIELPATEFSCGNVEPASPLQ